MKTTAPRAWLLGLGLFAACQAADTPTDEQAPAPDAPDTEAVAAAPAPAPALDDEEEVEAAELETLAGCNGSPASFAVSTGSAVGGPLVGFGAQFNAYLYHPSGRFSQGKTDELAGLVNKLHPQHVRIFFSSKSFRDPALKTSFSRTVRLAQNAGATINVTYWHGPYEGKPGTADFGKVEMTRFADALKAEFDAGHSAIKYVTIQNEPNRTKFNSHKQDLVQLYKTFHAAAQARGIRGRFALIPEMTRGYPGTKSYFKDWLKVIGAGAGNIIDGYAFHIYWEHTMQDSVRDRRLAELKEGVRALPAAQRKPMYVTEFGTRGEPDANKSVNRWPGWDKKNCTAGRKGCRRIADTTIAGANNAFFQIAAARAGFRAFVYWDAYWSMYDKADHRWSLIGRPSEGLRPKPTYYVQKLLSHAVGRGWVPVAVSNPGRQHLRSTAFKGDGKLTVLGVNKSGCPTTFRYSGLPASGRFYELVWNDDGSGTICSRGVRSAVGGVLTVSVRARSMVALSSRSAGLQVPSCGRSLSSVPGGECGDGECTEGEDDANCGQDCGCGAENACGTVAPWGCYCDATCEADGDCCADVGVCQ
jgi:hypothetical protein